MLSLSSAQRNISLFLCLYFQLWIQNWPIRVLSAAMHGSLSCKLKKLDCLHLFKVTHIWIYRSTFSPNSDYNKECKKETVTSELLQHILKQHFSTFIKTQSALKFHSHHNGVRAAMQVASQNIQSNIGSSVFPKGKTKLATFQLDIDFCSTQCITQQWF